MLGLSLCKGKSSLGGCGGDAEGTSITLRFNIITASTFCLFHAIVVAIARQQQDRVVGQSFDHDFRRHNRGFSNYQNEPLDSTSTSSTSDSPSISEYGSSGRPHYVTGESHFRAISETNSNFRSRGSYGDRARQSYRGGRGPNTYTDTNANANARVFNRSMGPPGTDDYRHWQYALKQPPSHNEENSSPGRSSGLALVLTGLASKPSTLEVPHNE
eukprot:Gb_22028 [translate_table: standard]